MDRMVFLAMSGAKQIALAQANNSHNLANASTPGFRADLQAFASLPVNGPTLASRVYASGESVGVDLDAGVVTSTGNNLDVAISREGYFAVQAPDGSEAYTRAGDFRVSAQGLLTNGAGHPVLGNGGPVALPPFERIQIGTDGTISIQPLGQSGNSLAVVDRLKLVNPDPTTIEKRPDGLLGTTQAVDADGAVRVQSGALESSNVNTVEALVNMIELARMFEMNVKTMKTASENDAATNQILRLG
ncbi:MAG: flagellar basal-body rod protein FlgF [Gammaproteobacteria bacterium]|jgi:flagellar basal-body rod protein FlgF